LNIPFILDFVTAIEQVARRAAIKAGLRATKTRWRANSIDNKGGFQIIDPYTNTVINGWRYDLSPEDVITFCKSKETRDK
jgi:hypothetical protein